MAQICLVSYELDSPCDVECPDDLQAPARYTSAKGREGFLQDARDNFPEKVAEHPCYARLSMVNIQNFSGASKTSELSGGKLTQDAMEFLLSSYPGGWGWNLVPGHAPCVIFVGFGIRKFLKILGHQCVAEGVSIPIDLWCGQTNYRDMESIIKPDGCDYLSWSRVFEYHGRPKTGRLSFWGGPGSGVREDMMALVYYAERFGLDKQGSIS